MEPFLASISHVHPQPLRRGLADPHRPQIASGTSRACRPARSARGCAAVAVSGVARRAAIRTGAGAIAHRTAHAVRDRLRKPPGPGRPDFVSIATETLWVANETVEFTTEELSTATQSRMGKIAAIWSTNLVLANRCVAILIHSLPWPFKPMQRASRSTAGCGFPP